MRKYSKALSLVLVALLAVALVGCGGGTTTPTTPPAEETPVADYKVITEGKLTVGSDLDFPPMEMLNGTTPEGFDVDLMTAIAEEMGLVVEYLPPQKFDTLLAEVNAGKFDVVASSLTINDERKKEVVFTDSYFDSNQSIAMKAGATYSAPADLKGKKVGAQSGTTGEAWATENLKPAGATIVPFSKTSEAFSALEAGNVDAVVNDLPITADIVKQKAGKLAVVSEIPTGEQYGFAVAIENPELATAINEALAALKASGEYQTIYDKWFATK
ncbi:MAG: amino acid ABC transporter substrate-binding protein [Coriobacteriaceae bacterium]|nr:amino acid ABC transporter substrate-binding protein [Coriobacteriaceae bacterium]